MANPSFNFTASITGQLAMDAEKRSGPNGDFLVLKLVHNTKTRGENFAQWIHISTDHKYFVENSGILKKGQHVTLIVTAPTTFVAKEQATIKFKATDIILPPKAK